ncbi:hypothetical protein ACO0SA_004377 [Hanseniaspora valbyensis]
MEENKQLRHDISLLKSELLKHITFNDLNKLLKSDNNKSIPSLISSSVSSNNNSTDSDFNNSTANVNSASNIIQSYGSSITKVSTPPATKTSFSNIIPDKNNIKSESPNPTSSTAKKLIVSPSSFGLSTIITKSTPQQDITPVSTTSEVSIVPPRSSNRKNSSNGVNKKNLSAALDLNHSDTSLMEATIEEDEDMSSKNYNDEITKDEDDNDDEDDEDEEDFNLMSITNKNTKRSVQMKSLNNNRLISPSIEKKTSNSPRLLNAELNDESNFNYKGSNDNSLISAINDSVDNGNISSQFLNVPNLQHDLVKEKKSSSSLIKENDRIVANETKNNIEFFDRSIKPPKSPVPISKPIENNVSDNNDGRTKGHNNNNKSVSSSIQLSPSPSILGTPKLSPSPQLLKSLTPTLKQDENHNKPATSTTYTTSRIQIKHQSSNADIKSNNSNNSGGSNTAKKTQQTPTKIKILDDLDMTYTDPQSQRSSIYNQQQNPLLSPRNQLLLSPRSAANNRHNVIYENKLHSPMRMEPLDISEIEEDLKSFNDIENTDLNLDIENVKLIKTPVTDPIKSVETPQKNESLFVQPNELKTIDIVLVSCIHFLDDTKELGFLFEVVDKSSGKKLYEFRKKYEQVLRLLLVFQKFTDMSLDLPSQQSDEENCIPLKIITRYINISNIFRHALKFSVDSNNLTLLMKLAEFISTNISINTFGKSNYHFDQLFKEENIKAENYCLIKRYKTLGTSSNWKCRCVGLIEIDKSYFLKFMDLKENVVESLKISSNTILEFYDNNEQDMEKYGCYNGFYISENGKKSGISSSKNNSKFYLSFETKKIRDEWIKKVFQIVKTSTLISESAQQQTYSDVQSIKSEDSTESSSTTAAASSTATMTRSELKRNRMRSLFPFKPKEQQQHNNHPYMNNMSSSENLPERQSMDIQSDSDNDEFEDKGGVFGNLLHFALIKSKKNYESYDIPTVVYNCLQRLYVDKHQLDEEGIFRISGSALTIKNLIEKFDSEFDVSLKDVDVHVVTGLLKTYLRMLPDGGGILGFNREKSVEEFKKVIDLELPTLKVLQKFKVVLWNRDIVDEEHFGLCFALFELLWQIVGRNSVNKMNLRNIVIVFAPTLDLSIDILVHFIRDFNYLFKKDVVLDTNVPRDNLQLSIPGM